MDAVFIALMVTMPIIGVATALYLWVRRGSDGQRPRRKTILLSVAVAVWLLPSGWEVIQHSKWYRCRIGFRAVAFANETGTGVRDVEFVFRSGDGGRWTNHLETLSVHGKYEHSVSGPVENLVLERASCIIGTSRLVSTNVGIAGLGEVLVVKLNPAGSWVVSHR